MRKNLPARPNLEHLRAQAKTLLTKLRNGDAEAAKAFVQYLPEAARLSSEQVHQRGYRLADAQAVIARKTGFAAWPGLARHVDRLRHMEGTWAFQSLEVDGETLPPAMFANSRILIDGDCFRMESPEGNYEGVFVIDVEAEPQRIDIDFVEGPEAGNRCEGLFLLDADRVTFCLALAGSSRPERFATAKGSGHALEALTRVDAARPSGVTGGDTACAVASPAPVPVEFEAVLTPTLEQLQGEWTPVELLTSGTPLPAAYLPSGSRIQTGVETKVVFGGRTMVHAKLRCNEDATPIEIDYLNLTGSGKGSVSHGIFRWDQGDAVFCMAPAGSPRPLDFSCAPGSGRILSRWKRSR